MANLSWHVPYWSYVRRDVRALRSLFRPRSAFRRLLAAGILAALILGVAKAVCPALDVHAYAKLPVALLAVPVLTALIAPLFLACRPFVKLTPETLAKVHGNTAWTARIEDCTGFRVVLYSSAIRRLIFLRAGRRQAFGLDESVELSELRALLPRSTRVVDARRRFARSKARRVRRPRL